MKNYVSLFIMTFFIVMLSSVQSMAQSKSTPAMSADLGKVIAESHYLVAKEVTLMPGEKTAMHTHPAHFYYALTPGKLIVHYKDGKTETYELKAGEGGASDPERPHYAENPGTEPIKFLIVELKEHPYKEPQKKK